MSSDDLARVEDSTPILVGSGQITDTTSRPTSARSPSAFMAEAAQLALDDARAAKGAAVLATMLDAIVALPLFTDYSPRFSSPFGRSDNPPRSIANRIGATNARDLYYAHVGGNMPQYMVNKFAEQITRGEIRAALVAGAELMRTNAIGRREKLTLDWNESPGGEPRRIGDDRLGYSPEEERHGLNAAIYFYPLIENAIRAAAGRSLPDHMKSMGRLFEGFARVAKANPLATRREGYSAERIATVDAENRFIAFPYPRLMNSNALVDQAAAIVMTSVGHARALGIPGDRWVFLHGCADGTDTWVTSERTALHRSAAIRGCATRSLDMAGRTIGQIDLFDLYSCFPSAVEIGCREIGLAEDDPRGLTVTGGLPFFGGPGNNYVTHSIAEMTTRLRARPGAFGMVTANGNYVTKHSAGIYSRTPTEGTWSREDPRTFQAELDALPRVHVETTPTGTAKIETYTVTFDRETPQRGIVFGRLENGARFVANTPDDQALLQDMITRDQLGRPGTLSSDGKRNIFTPG
ncbi:MAG: acetyl-CoA acetyltransferase [Alphaproteobacteria bacterium]|nr:acetyl-CoA acetyltransferase [Alphaproteobacteria bacterium]MCW5739054.1 acetyl-CoA acetyltransferase [Alphaproteobacteria bacterium]